MSADAMDDAVDERTDRSEIVRWIVAAVAALAIVALLAWARRDPGFDDRIPDPEDAKAVIVDGTAFTHVGDGA